MPKIKCHCNAIIWLGDIPSPHQYMIISDKELDNFHGQVDTDEIYDKMKIVVHCPACKRLHIYWDGFNNEPETYIKQPK